MNGVTVVILIIGLTACVAVTSAKRCSYDRHEYLIGEKWTTIEGCNQCRCTEQGMICTANECNLKKFAKPNHGAWNCNSEGDWYDVHDFWKVKDGCNTCYCKIPGNFRGYQVCTTTDCSLIH